MTAIELLDRKAAAPSHAEEPVLALAPEEWATLTRHAARAELTARMADVLVHDFNNLLTGIAGFADLALKRTTIGDPIAREIDNIRTISDKGARLLRSFWTFTARPSAGVTSININTIIAGLADILLLVIPKHVDLEIIADPELGSIHANPSHIEEAILCLVAQACETIPEHGKLTLKTANANSPGGTNQSNHEAARTCQLTLEASDTGLEMEEATRMGLTDPAAAFLEDMPGPRFALCAAAAIANQYDGRVEVSRAPGHGTTITAYFPAIGPPFSRFGARR